VTKVERPAQKSIRAARAGKPATLLRVCRRKYQQLPAQEHPKVVAKFSIEFAHE